MWEWLKGLFRRHKYIPTRTYSTGATKYRCTQCKDELYVPLDWSYGMDISRLRGCKKINKRNERNCVHVEIDVVYLIQEQKT